MHHLILMQMIFIGLQQHHTQATTSAYTIANASKVFAAS
jgi:hypothetical protein